MDKLRVVEFRGAAIYHCNDSFSKRNFKKNRAKFDLILSNVNFSVDSGEMVYLIGRVGSGKSSLLKTMYAELPLMEGQGMVAGYDLASLKKSHIPYLRRKIGVVFQDYRLLTDRNIYQNLLFVLKATGWKDMAQIRARIEQVVSMVSLNNKEHKMPSELSGGEQQRLSIARALLNNPQLILADEPTGNLDPAAADEIMKLFASIRETGCAVIMSTHNISNIEQYPSRTIRFNQGEIEEIDINAILGI